MAPHLSPKVIWSEGMLLGPHQFQQSDRYHERLVDTRVRPLAPYGWGAISLEIDTAALENSGIFMLDTFYGVFSSGTCITIPDGDRAPISREVPPHAFSPSSDRLGVYLALPADRRNALNYGMSGGEASRLELRYVPEAVRVVDECSGEHERDLVVARKNLRIVFEGEPSDGLERLKIAELLRSKEGRLTMRRDYIPPCLLLSASPYLPRLLQDLHGELTAAGAALLGVQQQRSHDRYEYRNADPDTLWLLTMLNGTLPVLAHHCQTRQVHPEVVYRSLLQLAGQLTTLSVQVRAGDLPPYDHDNLSASFTRLAQMLRTLLAIAVGAPSTQVTSVRLEDALSAASFAVLRTATAIDEPLFDAESRFYLAIRAVAVDPARQDTLNEQIPDMATIAPLEAIDTHIELAYGLAIVPAYPPRGALRRPGAAYFALKAEGEVWAHLQRSRMLALHVPRQFRREFTQFEGELLVIREDGASED